MAAPKIKSELFPPRKSRIELVEDNYGDLTPKALAFLDRQEIGRPHQLPDGVEQRYLYTFSNSTDNTEPKYEVRLYEPSSRQRLQRGLTSTVPWLTGLDGHHESVNEEAIASGLVSAAVSREVGGVLRASRQIGHIFLAQEAHIQLLVHQDLANRGHFMKEEVTGTGYSLAAIVLNGVAAFADQYNTNLVHGEALDPGPAYRLKPDELDPRSLTSDAAKELGELFSVLRHSSPHEAKRLLRTFPLSVQHTIQNFGFFIALTASGEGAKLAANVPKDTSLNITAFKGFRFNQVEGYRKIFANHKGVRITEEEGYHFSGANKKWRMLMIGRTALIQRELDAGITAPNINHKKVDIAVRSKIKKNNSLKGL